MCCIFTCCGWIIDLIQRLWTFTMSCCISSAVCCALVTASMSGIALGYNYLVAEYIGLKETNVAVYMKRGVFDDEIRDDRNWRRSGDLSERDHFDESSLKTSERHGENPPIRSGRWQYDYMYESDYGNKFKGSLMKLTVKAPAPSPSFESETTVDVDQLPAKYSVGSVDQIKAIQTLINMQKTGDSRHNIVKGKSKETEQSIEETYLPYMPIYYSGKNAPGRTVMPKNDPGIFTDTPRDSARLAVLRKPINDPNKRVASKLPPKVFTRGKLGEYDVRPTIEAGVTLNVSPVRPTRSKPTARLKPTLTTAPKSIVHRREHELRYRIPKSIKEEMPSFTVKHLLDKFDGSSFKEDFMNNKDPKQENEDYEDAVKRDPTKRKKRESVDSNSNRNGSLKYSSSVIKTKFKKFVDYDINKTNNFLLYYFKDFSIDILSKDKNITSIMNSPHLE